MSMTSRWFRRFAYTVTLGGLAAAAACSGAGGDDEAPNALASLEAETGGPWTAERAPRRSSLLNLIGPRDGRAVLSGGADPVATSVALLSRHKRVFGMRDPG